MVYITAIHMVGGSQHEHISEVRWRDPQDGGTGNSRLTWWSGSSRRAVMLGCRATRVTPRSVSSTPLRSTCAPMPTVSGPTTCCRCLATESQSKHPHPTVRRLQDRDVPAVLQVAGEARYVEFDVGLQPVRQLLQDMPSIVVI